MRAATFLLLIALVLTSACGAPEPTEIRVGAHVFSVMFPEGWEHFNYGERHQFRKDFERISLEDLRYSGRDLEESAEEALVQFREDERREIASSRHFLVDDHDALAIDTWDRVSHEFRKSYVFVDNEGDLLAISMMQGRYELMEPAFAELVASVDFPDSLETGGNQPQ